jgi:hypothetical protein
MTDETIPENDAPRTVPPPELELEPESQAEIDADAAVEAELEAEDAAADPETTDGAP